MSEKKLLPKSPVCSVRADTSIGECVRILRDKSLGALIITSDNSREDIVGVFTERDLVKNIELIHRGGFWDSAVRTVMTTPVRTVSVEKIGDAAKIMARYNIRHLPVIKEVKGKTYVVGVLSMRDIFRIVMEQIDFDLGKVFSTQEPVSKKRKKLIGVFSADPTIINVVDKGAKLTKHLLVKSAVFKDSLSEIEENFEIFDVIFIDIEAMSNLQLAKLFSQCRALSKENSLYIAFNPVSLNAQASAILHKLASRKQVHILSKPIALGLLYEKFIKELG